MVILWVHCYKIFNIISFISNILFFINIGDFQNSDISNKEHIMKALAIFWYHVCFSMSISS